MKIILRIAVFVLALGNLACPASHPSDANSASSGLKPILPTNQVAQLETQSPHGLDPLWLGESPQIEIWEQEELAAAEPNGEDSKALKQALSLKVELLKTLYADPIKTVDGTYLGGVNRKSLLTLPGNVKAIFKPGDDTSEVAAYALDQLLHFRIVPMTAIRTLDGEKGIIQIFMKGTRAGSVDLWSKTTPEQFGKKTLTTEELRPLLRNHKKLHAMKLFDEIILNVDRHAGNYLVDKNSNRAVAIDHGQAFFSLVETQDPNWQSVWNHRAESREELVSYLEEEPEVKNQLKTLPDWVIKSVLSPHLSEPRIDGVLERIHSLQELLASHSGPTH